MCLTVAGANSSFKAFYGSQVTNTQLQSSLILLTLGSLLLTFAELSKSHQYSLAV